MKPDSKKAIKKSSEAAYDDKNYIYLDDTVKDFAYSDFVRINTNERGILLAFGKSHP
jgi:predicted GNAT superfamily acetyltransferase